MIEPSSPSPAGPTCRCTRFGTRRDISGPQQRARRSRCRRDSAGLPMRFARQALWPRLSGPSLTRSSTGLPVARPPVDPGSARHGRSGRRTGSRCRSRVHPARTRARTHRQRGVATVFRRRGMTTFSMARASRCDSRGQNSWRCQRSRSVTVTATRPPMAARSGLDSALEMATASRPAKRSRSATATRRR
jgi:hypothetical protein